MSAENSEQLQNVPENSTLCRLCSSKQNLVDMFAEDSDKCNFYQKLFLCATGIQIKKDDIVSKMVCQSCCEIAIKLHKYRTNAISNDKLLKEKYSPESHHEIRHKINLLSTINAIHLFNFTLKQELSDPSDPFKYGIVKYKEATNPSISETVQPSKVNHHPSVKILLNSNSRLIIPNEVLTQDLSPVVSLDEAEVTMWYEEQVNKVKKKLGNITIKKLTNSNDLENSIKSSCIDKTQIIRQSPTANTADHLLATSVSNTGSFKKPVIASNKLKTLNLSEIVNVRNVKRTKADEQKESTSTTNVNGNDSLLKKLLIKITSANNPNPSSQKSECNDETIEPLQDSKDKEVNSPSSSKGIGTNLSVPQTNKNKRTSSEGFSNTSKNVEDNNPIPNKKLCLRSKSMDATTAKTPATFKKIITNKIEENNAIAKKQSLSISNSVDASSKISAELSVVSKHILNDKDEKNKSSESSVSVTPELDSLFIINSSKTLKVFICPTCSLVCETKKMLMQHLKTHLACTSCKNRFKTVSCLETHVKNDCVMNKIHDNAMVKLIRIDSIPSIVEKYAQVFNDHSYSKEDNHFSNEIKYYNCQIRCENDVKIELENTETVQNNVTNNEIKTEPNVVCLSDDSDNDVEFTDISVGKEKEPPVHRTAYLDLTESELDITNKSFYAISKQHANQNDMMKSLYKKYNVLNKVQNTTQTFTPNNKNIKCTSNNIIVIQHMYTELLAYKIPIHFENRPKICARFGNSEADTKNTYPLEYWGHKKSIDIKIVSAVKNKTKNALSANPSSSNVVSSDLQDTLPFQIIDVSTDMESHTAGVKPITTSSPTSTTINSLLVASNQVNAPCLAELLSSTTATKPVSNEKTIIPNVSLPIKNINLNSLLNTCIPVSKSQRISLDAQPDLGVFSGNSIILNSLPSTSRQNNFVIKNNISPLSNIILVTNQTPQSVISNILCNPDFARSVNTSMVKDNVTEPQSGMPIEIIDLD